ncbi:MAG: DUF4301 family protein [Syntrophobacteraceae bacterium]
MTIRFTDADRQQMESLGISVARVFEQIEIFRRSDFLVRLKRPCTVGDGVRKIDDTHAHRYIALHASAAGQDRFMKFVPASGAATRMFQSLLQIYYLPQYLEKDEFQIRLAQGVSIACDLKRFVDHLHEFAFVHSLRQVLAGDGYSLDDIVRDGRFGVLLEYLLTERGLNYGSLPKAMLQFHCYPEEQRTAFEEQLAESVMYLGADGSKCSLHFTVPEEHEAGFRKLRDAACRRYSDRHGADFDVSFSFQKSSTNTIAVNMKGSPFRDRFGRLHFRPAGHGALIENLNDLQADLIYIKNVDNVVPDRLKETLSFWKKVLGGCLVSIQEKIHSLLRQMEGPDSSQAVLEAAGFAMRELPLSFPAGFEMWSEDKRRAFLLKLLDRPIRVCGVVPNAGEPGGAPFWVEGENGVESIQIVEKAQVDLNSSGQSAIWNSSTHFNPVDIVCCTRDFKGNPYDLKKFVDPQAVIISRKSKDGSDIQALELPGLWNGGMAEWITLMIEVPPATFNPVKSVYDLLRPEHQPETQTRCAHLPGN